MNINSIDTGPEPADKGRGADKVRSPEKAVEQRQLSSRAPEADSVAFSQAGQNIERMAQRLVHHLQGQDQNRRDKVDKAKEDLRSGELDKPAKFAAAAESLLKEGARLA